MTGTDTICQFVDTIVDEYITTKKKIRVDFFKYLQSEDIDRKSINEYTSDRIHFITEVIDEVEGALNGDKILSEAYGCYKTSELRELKSLLDRFVSDVEKYKNSKRITRRKKVKSPDQMTRALNLIDKPVIIEGEKYNPIPKVEIIDAKSVFLINVKTNELLFLSGKKLSCSGAKIVNYDESISGMKKIKQINETIKSVLSCNNITCSTTFNNFPNKVKSVPKTVSPNYFLIRVIK